MDDIVAEHRRWKDLVARYELAAAGAPPERGESSEMVRLRRDIDAAAERINGYVKELEAIGCQLKGLEQVVIPSMGYKDVTPVFHLYVIRCKQRDELAKHMEAKGFEVGVH